MKKVAVVILNFKVKDETIGCIQSVKKSTYPNVEIIVVDNGSDDGLGEEIGKEREIVFIQNKENLGYSGGNNVGIKYALKKRADFIFILNPDAKVDPRCIDECVKVFSDQNIGIVAPKIFFGDKKTIWFAGGVFDYANVLGKHRGVNEKDSGKYDKVEETDYATGGAMFARAEVFKKIGLFDEKYFLYYEDSDFSFRAKQAGFKILYLPTAIVYHENAKSTGLGSPLQDYFITRNRMLIASKFLPLRTRFALLREALKNLGNPIRRLALWDFLTDNLGKGSYR